ncbi:Uncharacterised protein [Mycobacteroides abscessus subsp. abscessus]|nr:Uncharacterised protein [Mycobacteroides abscessus subsp. abscessus]
MVQRSAHLYLPATSLAQSPNSPKLSRPQLTPDSKAGFWNRKLPISTRLTLPERRKHSPPHARRTRVKSRDVVYDVVV